MKDTLKVLVLIVVALLFGIAVRQALAQEPDMNQLSPPPEAAYGVTKCGEVIALWVLQIEGDGHLHAYRTDVFHHPEDPVEYNAFLDWVKLTPKGRLDIIDLPCDKKP